MTDNQKYTALLVFLLVVLPAAVFLFTHQW